MPDITKIKIGNEQERSYKNFPANREFKKRAEDDNPGGGGWPADLPKPSVGGYGYAESGERTVINESVTTVDDHGMGYGHFATPFDIVDGAYTVIFNGTEYNLNSTFNEKNGFWYLGDPPVGRPDFSRYPFIIMPTIGDKQMLGTESAGDYEVTIIKKPSETIHVDGTFHDNELLTDEYTLIEGQKYNVMFNGIKYNNLITFDDYGYITIGSPYGKYDDYPFSISNDRNGIYLYTELDGDCTVLITTENEVIHKIDEKYLPASSTLFYVDDTNTDGYLDDNTLYLDEDRTIAATLEDIQASVGTVVQLIATSGRIYTPVECMTRSNEYGFVVIRVKSSDGTLKPLFFKKVRFS